MIAVAIAIRPQSDLEAAAEAAGQGSGGMLPWPVAHTLFAVQVIYGYLAAPFFIFTLPVIKTVLTHTVPTAYDREGRCRKPIKNEVVSSYAKQRIAEEEDAKKNA